jgi:hypothetical protein
MSEGFPLSGVSWHYFPDAVFKAGAPHEYFRIRMIHPLNLRVAKSPET